MGRALPEGLVSLDQAAEELGTRRQTLVQMLQQEGGYYVGGELLGYRLGTRQWRIRRPALDLMLGKPRETHEIDG